MKIVVDKKIKKFDGDVEDLLQTSEIVTESEDIQVIEAVINESSYYALSSEYLAYFCVVSDNPIEVRVQQQGSNIVNLPNMTEFSYTGNAGQYLNIILQNLSETDKAKIKVVMVV